MAQNDTHSICNLTSPWKHIDSKLLIRLKAKFLVMENKKAKQKPKEIIVKFHTKTPSQKKNWNKSCNLPDYYRICNDVSWLNEWFDSDSRRLLFKWSCTSPSPPRNAGASQSPGSIRVRLLKLKILLGERKKKRNKSQFKVGKYGEQGYYRQTILYHSHPSRS